MKKAWFFLLLAICTEVGGTLAMNASGHTGNPAMYALMFALIGSSYFFLSFALRGIAVGIAIAVWEGLGTSLITFISLVFLDEPVSPQKAFGLSLAMVGIALLHYGELDDVEQSGKPSAEAAQC